MLSQGKIKYKTITQSNRAADYGSNNDKSVTRKRKKRHSSKRLRQLLKRELNNE
jgi:hypothetical protein